MNKNKKLVFLMALVMLISSLSLFTVSFAAEDLGSWQTKTSMSYTRFSFGVAEVNGKIYAIGGRSHAANRDKVEEYDPLTDTWVTKTSMPAARYALEAAGVNGKIYAIGGIDNEGNTLSIVEEYDPLTDTWATKSSMATARYDYALAEANGKIYAIGGKDGDGFKNTVEEYDPLTDTWVTKTSMPTARYALEATEVNGKIYVVGGNAGSNHSDVVEEYDPIADTWTTKTSMPTGKYYFGLEECDGKIYAVGGNNAIGGNTSSIVEEYDPLTDTWATKASMPTGRYDYELVASNGKIYAIGGYGTTYLKTVEEFTPPVTETLSLDIESSSYEVAGGTEFETYAVIKSAESIYAEDMNITYDTSLFELVGAEPVDSNALKIYYEEIGTLGQARYITASKGAANSLEGDQQILKLTFKAKNVDGSGDIAVVSGLVANGDGNEITPFFGGKTFTVTKQNLGDVNKDGKFTLGDLAIAGRLFESTSDTWGIYEPDVDANGSVEDIDLTSVVQSILAN